MALSISFDRRQALLYSDYTMTRTTNTNARAHDIVNDATIRAMKHWGAGWEMINQRYRRAVVCGFIAAEVVNMPQQDTEQIEDAAFSFAVVQRAFAIAIRETR